MAENASFEQRMAYVLLRASMGVSFCVHGFVRIAHEPGVFAQGMVKHMTEARLPVGFVYGFSWVLPFFEALLGLMLLAGVKTRWALVAGALLMMTLISGSGLLQDWSSVALQLFYSFLFCVLLFLREPYEESWVWIGANAVQRAKSP